MVFVCFYKQKNKTPNKFFLTPQKSNDPNLNERVIKLNNNIKYCLVLQVF